MSILIKHILRNIREYKFRSILIVFSLTVSTMVLFLNLTIKDDLGSKYRALLRGSYQDYDIQVNKKVNENSDVKDKYFNPSELKLQNVISDNTLAAINTSAVYTYKDEKDTKDKVVDVYLYGCDKEKFKDNNLCEITKKTSDYDVNADNQVIISEKSAKKFNLKLGDMLTVSTLKGEQKFKVTALSKSKGVFIIEQDGILAVATQNTVSQICDSDSKVDSVYLDIKNADDVKKVIKDLKADNKDYEFFALVDEDQIQEALDMINQLLMIVLVAVIILNFYVISSITKLIMATRIPVVGTFRSIGATKRKMNFILILENAMYGVIGSVFGILFGILLREPVSSLFIQAGDSFDYVKADLSIKPWYIIIAVAFSILLQITISLSSILKTSKKPIKDIIFNTLSTTAKFSKKKTVLGCILLVLSVVFYGMSDGFNMLYPGLGIVTGIAGTVFLVPIFTLIISKILSFINRKIFGGPAELGTKALYKSKTTRSSIVLVTVSISIMMMIYMMTLSVSDIFTKAEDTFDADVQISYLDKKASEYDYLKNVEGVTDESYVYYSYGEFKLNGKTTGFIVYGDNQFDNGIKGKESDLKKLGKDGILVDDFFAHKQGIKVGDTITIDEKNMKERNRKYVVKGFINGSEFTTQRTIMMVSLDEYKATFTDHPANIYIKTSKDADEMKETLKKELAGQNVYIETKDEFIGSQRDSTNGIIGMVEAMLGLSVILSILGLMNNQVIGFIQRKREYAVLYSTCMSKSQLRRMILFETFGTFVSGCTIGTVLSLWLTRLLSKLVSGLGICIDITIKYKELGIALAIVLCVLSLTALSPMRKISKIKVVDEIKYE